MRIMNIDIEMLKERIIVFVDDIMHDYYNGLSVDDVIDIKFSSKQENKL